MKSCACEINRTDLAIHFARGGLAILILIINHTSSTFVTKVKVYVVDENCIVIYKIQYELSAVEYI